MLTNLLHTLLPYQCLLTYERLDIHHLLTLVTFIRFYNNTLGINSRLHHFVQNVNTGCAFCTANHENIIPPETFVHLFYECRYTNNIITATSRILLPEINFPTENSKKLFWLCGINPQTGNNFNLFLFSITWAI